MAKDPSIEKNEFASGDMTDFFDKKQAVVNAPQSNIVVFTEKQRTMIENVLHVLQPFAQERCDRIQERIRDLRDWLQDSKFSVPLKSMTLPPISNTASLINSLITISMRVDTTLQYLPRRRWVKDLVLHLHSLH